MKYSFCHPAVIPPDVWITSFFFFLKLVIITDATSYGCGVDGAFSCVSEWMCPYVCVRALKEQMASTINTNVGIDLWHALDMY